MITEERVMAILATSNPVPTLDHVELAGASDTKHLEVPEHGSDEMSTRQDTPIEIEPAQRRGSPAIAWAIAAIVVVVAGIGIVLATRTTDDDLVGDSDQEVIDPQMQADIETIQRHHDAWYSGDYETAMAMVGEAPRDDFPLESLHQAAIGGHAEVGPCTKVVPGDREYSCSVSYTNVLYEAAGEPPLVAEVNYRVVNEDLIVIGQRDGVNYIEGRWFEFVDETGLGAVNPCEGAASSECSTFMVDHLEEFGVWYAQTYGPPQRRTPGGNG